ncbi:hypothetical protein [Deinococcus sp. JMULE3]|uniref:hypothetical protein n=1 Tax=Deinococcus sp. JMULE3 TaxID=2518341 RepID=UPI001575FCBB|nr:hypothetical protein [Deinococcus sp. JMULE3]NTY01021.1 hypothetical protein [Deinococcus sp. JMULE3]
MRRTTVAVWAALLGGVAGAQPDAPVLRGTLPGWADGAGSVGVLLPFPGGDDRRIQAARGTLGAAGDLTLPLPDPARLAGAQVPLVEWLNLEPLGCVTRSGKITFSDPAAQVFPLNELRVAAAGRTFPSVGSIVGEDLWQPATILNSEVDLLAGQDGADGRLRFQRLVFSAADVTVSGEARCVPDRGMPEQLSVNLPLRAGWNVVQEDVNYAGEDAERSLTLAPPDTVTVWQAR